jgi:hypothetical protein
LVRRASVMIVVVATAVLAGIGVTERDWPLVAFATACCVVFAANLVPRLSRPVRLLLLVAQGLMLVTMLVAVVAVLVMADAGITGLQELQAIPWWCFASVVAFIVFTAAAVADGYHAYRGA